jgi:hypothetical protein
MLLSQMNQNVTSMSVGKGAKASDWGRLNDGRLVALDYSTRRTSRRRARRADARRNMAGLMPEVVAPSPLIVRMMLALRRFAQPQTSTRRTRQP